MRLMHNSGFKDQFGAECRRVPVGKKDRFLAVYPSIKEGIRLLSKINKKDQTWVLFSALYYKQPVVLHPINLEADLTNVDAEEEDVVPAASQVVDVLQAMIVCEQWILDSTALMDKVSPYLQDVDVNVVVDLSAKDQVIARIVCLCVNSMIEESRRATVSFSFFD